jgi:HlyD family secretion protein
MDRDLMKKKKWLWLTVGAIVFLAGGFLWLNNNSKDEIKYRTAKVDRGDIQVVISATGTLNAVTTVQVGSQVSGTIAKLYADFNTKVSAGQLLAQLDPTFLQASVNEQRANVDRAKAQVNEAERNFNRTSDLFAKLLVSQADMDAAKTTLEASQASLAQGAAALERVSVNLRYATIKAPISGVVISRNVDVGQTVAASLQAPTLFTIAQDLRKMQVQASIDEADIGNVKVNQEATFRVDSYPEETFRGEVSQIRLAPVITQNVVTYNVIIDVDNPQQRLMPGMTATVSIEVTHKKNVMRAPLQAARFNPPAEDDEEKPATEGRMMREGRELPTRRVIDDTSRAQGERLEQRSGTNGNPSLEQREKFAKRMAERARIWILENGKPKAIFVEKGIQNTRYMEIVESSLKEGDEIIVGSNAPQGQQQVGTNNPFAPRMPGGGGRRGGI